MDDRAEIEAHMGGTPEERLQQAIADGMKKSENRAPTPKNTPKAKK